MGTKVLSLSKVLFGQSRRSILTLLYGHADEQFYLREIARRAGTGIGATQRELGQLTDAGLLHRLRRGNQVYYRANRENPIFEELRSILAKTSGIRDTLQEGLARLADRVKLAFVYGSIARGEEKASSDVDLMVVGEVSFSDVVSAKPLGTERLNAAVCQKIHSDPFALTTNPICFCSRYRLSFVLSDNFRASPRPTAFYLVPRKRSTISGSIGSTASV
jgi:uncharacterized protein